MSKVHLSSSCIQSQGLVHRSLICTHLGGQLMLGNIFEQRQYDDGYYKAHSTLFTPERSTEALSKNNPNYMEQTLTRLLLVYLEFSFCLFIFKWYTLLLKHFFIHFFIAITISSPASSIYLISSHISMPSIPSFQKVRCSMGSQQRLAHSVKGGRTPPPCLPTSRMSKTFKHMEWALKS